jgi:hypothetical protein
MEWVEIQVRVAVDRADESSELVATIGDAVAAHATRCDRPWFMTSELVSGETALSLKRLLSGRRRGPASAQI